MSGPGEGDGPELRRRLAELLRDRRASRVDDGEADRRAAVVLTLRPREPAGGLLGLETLIVRRAERASDPWSGHASLPGGHREPGDADLAAAALRELREETGLALPREAILGRLDEIHPRSRRLPSVAVTPFVAWEAGGGEVAAGPEVADHLWTPLRSLRDPARRSVLTVRREDALRAFPTVEVGGLTVWGLTFAILRRFLSLLPPEEETTGAADPRRGGRARPDEPATAPGAGDGTPEGRAAT